MNPPMGVPKDDPSSKWRELLLSASYTDGVDYSKIQKKRQILDAYISWVAGHGPHADGLTVKKETQKMAFYVNAYNAFVVYGILENWPVNSVKDIRVGPYPGQGSSFFFGQLFRMDNEWISLYHLQTEMLIANFQYPELHFMLHKGTKSSPKLRYWSSGKPAKSALRTYLKSEYGAQKTKDGWAVSELFLWHKDDFVYWSHADNLCEYLYPYATDEFADWLLAHQMDCQLDFIEYDWALNQKQGSQ